MWNRMSEDLYTEHKIFHIKTCVFTAPDTKCMQYSIIYV